MARRAPGVQDLFTPEINSDAPTPGSPNDWTTDNALTQQYDGYKVHAVLNEIAGMDHSGTTNVGTPAIYGLNFQTVSTAEKLPTSDGLTGGYAADGVTPGPLLARALDFIDSELGAIRAQLDANGESASTTIVLTAKHGQSPTKPADLTRIPDGPIIDALNAAWQAAHPTATAPLVALRDRRRRDADVAQRSLAHGDALREGLPPATSRASATTSRATRSRTRARAWTRSSPAATRRASSACRRTTRACPTSTPSRRSASSTRARRRRSPSTAAPTRPTCTCRS